MAYSEHFSLKNIPYGIATGPGHAQKGVATRIHDKVIFLSDLDIESSEEIKQALGEVMRGSSTDPIDRLLIGAYHPDNPQRSCGCPKRQAQRASCDSPETSG